MHVQNVILLVYSSDGSRTSKPLVPQLCPLSDLWLNTQLFSNLFNFLQTRQWCYHIWATMVLPYMGDSGATIYGRQWCNHIWETVVLPYMEDSGATIYGRQWCYHIWETAVLPYMGDSGATIYGRH